MREGMLRGLAGLSGLVLAACASTPDDEPTRDPLDRPLAQEVVYHLLIDRFENGDPSNDRGGLTGDVAAHGFDPSDPFFYHGGDLAGVEARLDYVRGLGATTILLGPITKGLPTARAGGRLEGGYHGEWPTHLDEIDPHFGDADALERLVAAAHERGLRVVLDVVVNGTADLNLYEECGAAPCPYRAEASYPYTTRGPALGETINRGFRGWTDPDSVAALTDPNWAYAPVVPKDARSPDWLNVPVHYHNRGDARGRGEAYTHGDVAGLDDLFTEHPVVAEGLGEVYADWLRRTGADGVRLRAADRVSTNLWEAMLPSLRAAKAGRGEPEPIVWGEMEAGDRAGQARLLASGLPAVEDAAVSAAMVRVAAGAAPTRDLADAFASDALYPGGEVTARRLPTRLSHPDTGRLARAIRRARPRSDEAERLARLRLGHALLLTARGAPILYYGDEQGFGGSGDAARQDMFASRVPSYLDDDLLGTRAGLGRENFDPDHELYRAIADLAAMRRGVPALTEGRQVTRLSEDVTDGLFAFSRLDDRTGEEVLVVLNFGPDRRDVFVPVSNAASEWQSLMGYCASTTAAAGSYPVSVGARDFIVCRAER